MAGFATEVRESKAPEKRSYRKVHHLEVEPIKGENGGHMVTHHFQQNDSGMYHEPQRHMFAKGDGQAMLAHVAKHMGVPMEAEPEEEGEEE